MMGWQWHQLDPGCPSCRPTNSVKALKAMLTGDIKPKTNPNPKPNPINPNPRAGDLSTGDIVS